MKCKDCRFLGEPYVHTYYDSETGDDTETPFHVCDFVKHINAEYKIPVENVGVIDGSGYHAALVVKDDFGCVHFEPKTTGDANG